MAHAARAPLRLRCPSSRRARRASSRCAAAADGATPAAAVEVATEEPSPPAPPPTVEPSPAAPEPFVLPGELTDEAAAAMVAEAAFPIPPAELIERCKRVLASNNGCDEPSLLADSFQFVAPVVGPLSKKEFTEAFASFKLGDAFPDLNPNYHAFRVDPFEPSRVWYTTRAFGTHTGTLAGVLPPTGKKVDSPPQACSMCFNEQGECTQFTIGYVMDRTIGNTGGLGGVYGILYAIGAPLPFPEAQPWEKSWQYSLFQTAGGAAAALRKALGI